MGLKGRSAPADERGVFLNFPFDSQYRPLFIALIAGLAALGRTPRCVLEVPSDGQNRLERIYGLLASCSASVHDLSRVTFSAARRLPRFNMPFELGMAYVHSRGLRHRFFVFESEPHRLQATLSDFNGLDPHIHGGTQIGILRCILDCFGTPSGTPPISDLRRLTRDISRITLELQREQGLAHPFHSYVFRQAVGAAAELARSRNLIR